MFANAETPDWVTMQGKSKLYPESVYLTGYGMAMAINGVSETQARETAVMNARKNLVEKIRITIQATTTSRIQEAGETYSSTFSSAVQSTANMVIQGLQSEEYFDDDIAYAFVFLERNKVYEEYDRKLRSLKKELQDKYRGAEAWAKQNQKTKAIDEYLLCYPLIRQIEETEALLNFLSLSRPSNQRSPVTTEEEITVSHIQNAITALVLHPVRTVDDVGWYLAYQLREQLLKIPTPPTSLMVMPFTFQDTKMGSPFSRYFHHLLKQKMAELQLTNVVEHNADAIIDGTYWMFNTQVKFIVTARAVTEAKILASAEITVDSSLVTAVSKPLKPENYLRALEDQRVFERNEVVANGLTVEAWTNKENLNNLFVEGEKMTVAVRVNMPCYLRFIYHMADGKRVVLLDQYYIDQSKVNLVYHIPVEFECAEPFGSEVLQIFARTDKFEPVAVETIDGYSYLKEDLKGFVATTRGMKAAKPRSLQAEKRIQITTMRE